MDRELLKKEVLCIIDTKQIQKFIFHSNTMLDTIGGSDLILHIMYDAIEFALKNTDPPVPEPEYDLSLNPDGKIPWFEDSRIQFQLIFCAAGNAMFLARTGELAGRIVRKVSRYHLEHGYSLNIAAACVEKTDNIGRDISNIYRKLELNKAVSENLNPLGTLPVCIREESTGYPVVGYDEINGDPVSTSSALRRQEARKRTHLVSGKAIRTTTAFDRKAYKAVIHADGNNIGITIGKILQSVPDYEAGIRTRRRISRHLEKTIAGIMSRTISDLEDYYTKVTGKKDDFEQEFMLLHRGGDDINVMCNAIWAFPFFQFFYRNLKGAYICKTESMEVPLYLCGGIAFVTDEAAFHRAFKLAEECCSNAKTFAKTERNLRRGLAGNWIDFQVLDTPNTQDLEMLREFSYITKERVSLLLRPYCLDPEARDEEYSYCKLMNRALQFRSLSLDYDDEVVFRHSFLMGREEFNHFVSAMKQKGCDLVALLGEPACRDTDMHLHATWFDAAEVADFFPPDDNIRQLL